MQLITVVVGAAVAALASSDLWAQTPKARGDSAVQWCKVIAAT
jgi:hypothetical protein